MTFIDLMHQRIRWSVNLWGRDRQTTTLTNHIRKELVEIEESPYELNEWIDVILLALDGAWRTGHTPQEVWNAIVTKQQINIERKWNPPDEDGIIEHVRQGATDANTRSDTSD